VGHDEPPRAQLSTVPIMEVGVMHYLSFYLPRALMCAYASMSPLLEV
jgi:hypothetical protein